MTASCPLLFAGPGCRDGWKGLQVKLWEWGYGREGKSSARHNVSPILIDEDNSRILILRHSNRDLNSASAVLSFVDKDLKARCPLYDPRVSDFKFLTRWCWEMWVGRAEGTWHWRQSMTRWVRGSETKPRQVGNRSSWLLSASCKNLPNSNVHPSVNMKMLTQREPVSLVYFHFISPS